MSTIIQSIKKIRKSKKISQTEMGKFLSISQGTYRDIESEKIRLSLDNYLLICQYLEIDPTDLLRNNNETTITLTKQQIILLKSICEKL